MVEKILPLPAKKAQLSRAGVVMMGANAAAGFITAGYTYAAGEADPHIVNGVTAATVTFCSMVGAGFGGCIGGQVIARHLLSVKSNALEKKGLSLLNPLHQSFDYARRGLVIGSLFCATLVGIVTKGGTAFLKEKPDVETQNDNAKNTVQNRPHHHNVGAVFPY